MSEKPCTFVVHFTKTYPNPAPGIKTDLKYGDAAAKKSALKHAISIIINGDTFHFRDLSVIVVRYVLPCEDLTIQKLALLYLETVYKGEDVYGRVPPDTTLVGDYLRRNLKHSNEYIRGLTLRFISRLRDTDLLEPLVESVLVNLYHQHRFVRRHAYSAIFAIYLQLKPNAVLVNLYHQHRFVRRHAYSAIFAIYLQLKPNARLLIPDVLDRVGHKLSFERDAGAMRNAFFMLCYCARERAVTYLLANDERAVTEWPDIVQVVGINLIRCAFRCSDKQDQDKFIKIIIYLSAQSNSNSVIYEAADALLSLCPEPVAVCAATNAYFRLLFSPIDTDMKRIVLERLHELCSMHNDTICSLSPNVMNVKRLQIAEKVLLISFTPTYGKLEEGNGCDTKLLQSNEGATKLMQAIDT